MIAFALVAVALVGLLMEQGSTSNDNARSVVVIGVAALVGGVVAISYGRFRSEGARRAKLQDAAVGLVRFFLAFEMMRYGAAKIVGMQFYRRYWQLDMRVADMKPMTIAWSFFGASYAYQAFTGLAEIAAAVLLCFRRTAFFGACLLVAIMTNVVLVNFLYDVPVKLFSSIYLVMGLYLLARDRQRLWALIVAAGEKAPSRRVVAAHAVAVAVVLGVPAAEIGLRSKQYRLFHADPLEGAWNVDLRSGLDDVVSETSASWDKVYFEKGDYGFIRIGKQRLRFETSVDEGAATLRLSNIGGRPSATLAGTFRRDGTKVHVAGTRNGAPFALDLARDFPR